MAVVRVTGDVMEGNANSHGSESVERGTERRLEEASQLGREL